MLVSILYFSLFILSLLATALLLNKITNRKASYYIVLFVLITVVCLAYFAYSIAQDTGMALVANQFSYLDGTFVIMFFLFCIMDICNIRITKWIALPLSLIGLFFLLLAFTAPHHKLFYISYTYASQYGASHLQMELGPLYNFYLIYSVINMLIPIGIVIYSFFNKKKISYRHTLALACLLVAIVFLYFIEFSVGLGFDLLPCGYVLMEYVILGILQRIDLYDVSQIAADTAETSKEAGYVIFDTGKHYSGSNDTARYYFPELSNLDIDRTVTDSFILHEFVDRLDSIKDEAPEPLLYTRQGRKILCTLRHYYTGRHKRLRGYVLEMRDDTQQQDFIETLNKMNSDLAEAVTEANSANRAKSQFLASMSHEIRTPINAILGMNAIAMRECKDQALIEYLETIDNAGHNLLALINDILDLSKIEAGKLDIVEGDFKTARLIKDVTELIKIKTEEKGLEFTVNAPTSLPAGLHGDENRLRQVMVNILNNAVKYTPSGRVELTVEVSDQPDDSLNFTFSVRDTGMGIKPEDLNKLFENFSRLDVARNKNIEGTGLGLAITKKLVTAMGGDIGVESTYGQGSTFTVTLPLGLVDSSPMGNYQDISGSDHDIRSLEVPRASTTSILVVDDNPVNLQVVKGLLKPTEAKLTLCTDGKIAVNIITKKHFDIVFLDHLMPEPDGIETLHLIKQLPADCIEGTTFIALTANAITGIRDMFISEGFDDYISKPIEPSVLMEALVRYQHK